HEVAVEVHLVNEQERDREAGVEAGGDTELAAGAVRGEGDEVGFGQRGDFLHLRNAAGVAAVGLQDVDAPLVQVRQHSPDGPVPLAGRQRDFDVLLEPLEDFDVAGDGGLFEEQDVVGLDGGGELDEHGGGD